MSSSVIGKLFALRRHRHGLRIDCQLTIFSCDRVVFGHVFRAVHDLVAVRDRVVTIRSVSHVSHAAGRCRYQFITSQQSTACYGNFCILVSRSIICPFIARRCDRYRHFGFLHGQLAVCGCHCVVAGCASCELIALQLIRYRALTRERNAASDYCCDSIAAYQAVYIITRVAMSSSVIGKLFALRRDRQRLRGNLQPAVCYCQIICSIIVIFFCIYRNGKAFRIQAHQVSRICINISTCGFSGLTFCKCYRNTVGRRLGKRSASNAVLNLISCYALFLATVFLGSGITSNFDLQFRYPDGIHVLVRRTFVCSHLADCRSRLAAKMECTVITIEQVGPRIGSCFGSVSSLFNLCPANKPVTGTCLGAFNCHRFIYLNGIIFPECLWSVIHEPPDMSHGRSNRINILRTQLNNIIVLGRIICVRRHFSVICIYSELCTRIHMCIGIFIYRSIPLLNNPICKHFPIRRRRSRLCNRLSLVNI